MGNDLNNFSAAQWRELTRNLHAFAVDWYRRYYRAEANERGKSPKDYVNDAIEKHIRGEDNYDPNRGALEKHLKYNVIRRAIYNDLPPGVKKDNKAARESSFQESNLLQQAARPIKPFVEPLGLGLDQKLIFGEIEKEVSGDNVLEQIYLAVCHDTFELSDRKEICEECGLTPDEFDNGARRFKTVLKRVFTKLQITNTWR